MTSTYRVMDTRTDPATHAGDYVAETPDAAIRAAIEEVGSEECASEDPDDYEATAVAETR